MTKDQYKEKLISDGYIEDPVYANRLQVGEKRCHLRPKSFKIEQFVKGAWRTIKSCNYSKVK